ncbi:tumor necrosis factor ligand superfamily member 14 [Engraulis encrasicolus]|uniref:tumor necrosis factor ligand superfamily member 14 n=1 Tax=Engraulis encrasicolus TaxID=184585 RepID=UPI002FD70644
MSSSWPAGHEYPPRLPKVVVYTHSSYPPPLPPKPVKKRTRGTSMAQSLLMGLVILTLSGMVIGACLIYDLYQRQAMYAKDTPQLDSQKQVQVTTPDPLSNPMAHVIGTKKPGKDGVMVWEAVEMPDRIDEVTMHGVKYDNGRLIILKEGYYKIYSKLYLKDPINHMILHSIVKETTRYPKEIVILRSKKFRRKGERSDTTNSYLAGVFHLIANDAIFVKVNNHTDVILDKSADNYFGLYML